MRKIATRVVAPSSILLLLSFGKIYIDLVEVGVLRSRTSLFGTGPKLFKLEVNKY